MKRIFLLLFLVGILAASPLFADELDILPMGSAPNPEAVSHFPDKVHAFVWRNWNLVPVEHLAKVLETSPENVAKMADSLGLEPYTQPTWSTDQIYITLVRRNWHLLPYEQLLTLIEMTPERLAFSLREDDFLWVKLGLLKPKCEPIRYQEPDAATVQRVKAIKAVLEKQLDKTAFSQESRFAFIDTLKTPSGKFQKKDSASSSLRYIYSYFALFGDPLANDDAEIFPEGLLEKLSNMDVNGVWLHVVLRELAPGGDKFPEFGHGCEKRLANLRKLVARAQKYGINVYLYMNEPRTMPDSFFDADILGRKETAGVPVGGYTTLCISQPDVQDWIRDALAHVFTEVPDLGGVFTISGSENLTHCNSHGQWQRCPHCKAKSAAEVTALANALVEEGVHRAAPEAKVIVWDWGWNGHGMATEIIEKLPDNVWLQSVSEWALPIERGGIRGNVGEYSISSVGPGTRAKTHWEAAKKRGLKAVAKVQLNCTWEIAAVPFVPVMDLIAEHCSNLADCDIDGMMMSWSLGGYPSPNLEIPKRFDRSPKPNKDQVLDEMAVDYFGPDGASFARKAWTLMSNAYREYPYSGSTVYNAPVQIGPANLLRLHPTGYAATMVGIPYDALDSWRGHYPPEIFAGQFEKINEGFTLGIQELEKAVVLAPEEKQEMAKAMLRYAKVTRIHFASVANQIRFILLRDEQIKPETTDVRKSETRQQMIPIVENEMKLAKELYYLVLSDSSIGFESSNHYFYVPDDLLEKLVNCQAILDELIENPVKGR